MSKRQHPRVGTQVSEAAVCGGQTRKDTYSKGHKDIKSWGSCRLMLQQEIEVNAKNGSGGWFGNCLRGHPELFSAHMGYHKHVNISSPFPVTGTSRYSLCTENCKHSSCHQTAALGQAGLAFTLLPTLNSPSYEMQTLAVRYFGT